MYFLACCDNEGKCIGFLKRDKQSISTDPDRERNELLSFKRKQDTNEITMQINMSHLLLPNGYAFRVCAVRG